MSGTSKTDQKAALDIASWLFNVVTSVGIILVNKALMATYGFSFGEPFEKISQAGLNCFQVSTLNCFLIMNTATTLTGLHFGTTTLLTTFLTWLGYIQPSQLPWPDLLKFVLFANFSIVGMNVSLMWNSVGFYQVGASFVSFPYSVNFFPEKS